MEERLSKEEKEKHDSKNDGNSKQKKNDEDFYWNIYFALCILISTILIIFSCFVISDFKNNLQKYNKNYTWPKITELLPSLYILPLVMAYKTIIEYLSKGLVESCLAKKYKYPKNEEMKKLATIYRHKLARHIYKSSFYFGITIYGYYVLHNLPYFPKSMLGNGYMPNMFLKGYPDSYFYERSPDLILYYNINLAFFVNDFIFLFIMERQSDFIKMLLHHICTISLIIFSFIINYLNVGTLVLFCHMESDILLHITRFLLQTDNHIAIVGFIGIVFTINYIYMRQFVLGQIIYTLYKYVSWKWTIVDTTLWLFLVILYTLHLHWSYILVSKTVELLVTKKPIVDDVNYDKLIKGNNKTNIDKKEKKNE